MAGKHKGFHLFTEFLGVLLGTYLFVLGLFLEVHYMIKLSLILTGIGGMLIDSYCITTWLK
ncbi:hypothetical protein KY332_01880 [Candidatus Woesearchaeota archaeon]|nr:hypothetical protein [Candidatus Woesearchaeota archaeon]